MESGNAAGTAPPEKPRASGLWSPKTTLILAALLFFGWLGWLGSLALRTAHPVVLARPQFLISELDVVAQVGSREGGKPIEVQVEEVHWPESARGTWQGKPLTITNLADCVGWQGPGLYILPLVRSGDKFQVAPLPRSPGFEGRRPLIYPATSETRGQLDQIAKGVARPEPKPKDEGKAPAKP